MPSLFCVILRGRGQRKVPVESHPGGADRQQRFQGYANLPEKSLNADQRAAVASLPVLTAQSRELEDLIKPGGAVEVSLLFLTVVVGEADDQVVELNEAAKLRSAKEEAERLAKGDVDAQISSNIVSFLPSQNPSQNRMRGIGKRMDGEMTSCKLVSYAVLSKAIRCAQTDS